jgi:hypothetical protein
MLGDIIADSRATSPGIRTQVNRMRRLSVLSKRLMTFANVAIAEPLDKITAANGQRSGAVQDESSDRVCVLSEAGLKC